MKLWPGSGMDPISQRKECREWFLSRIMVDSLADSGIFLVATSTARTVTGEHLASVPNAQQSALHTPDWRAPDCSRRSGAFHVNPNPSRVS